MSSERVKEGEEERRISEGGRGKMEREAILKENEAVERIAKILKEIYGQGWNFEIDFSGDVEEEYTLKITLHKK